MSQTSTRRCTSTPWMEVPLSRCIQALDHHMHSYAKLVHILTLAATVFLLAIKASYPSKQR